LPRKHSSHWGSGSWPASFWEPEIAFLQIGDDLFIALPALVLEEWRDLLAQIGEKTARIDVRAKTAKELAAQANTARRLQTMPGVGPLIALAIEAFAPDMATFRSGRDFAAWLGLVPRQHSTGGKERL
jgi:transposase